MEHYFVIFSTQSVLAFPLLHNVAFPCRTSFSKKKKHLYIFFSRTAPESKTKLSVVEKSLSRECFNFNCQLQKKPTSYFIRELYLAIRLGTVARQTFSLVKLQQLQLPLTQLVVLLRAVHTKDYNNNHKNIVLKLF